MHFAANFSCNYIELHRKIEPNGFGSLDVLLAALHDAQEGQLYANENWIPCLKRFNCRHEPLTEPSFSARQSERDIRLEWVFNFNTAVKLFRSRVWHWDLFRSTLFPFFFRRDRERERERERDRERSKKKSYLAVISISCVRLCKSYSEVTSKVCHEEDAALSVERFTRDLSWIFIA